MAINRCGLRPHCADEARNFDKRLELVPSSGTTVKVVYVGACHSRMLFVQAYVRPVQEHMQPRCSRQLKTAVETIFVGKDRRYNRRFLQMCSH